MNARKEERSAGRRHRVITLALLTTFLCLASCEKHKTTAGSGKHIVATQPTSQISAPKAHLKQVGHFPAAKARDALVSANTLLIIQNLDGMTAADISDAHHPKPIRHFSPDEIQPLAAAEISTGIVAFADRFRGLVLWDLSRVDSPTSVGSLHMPGIATHLDILRNAGRTYACVACGGSGVAVVDVSNPTAPQIAGRYKSDVDYSRRIAVAGSVGYLADNLDGGLKVLNLSQPGSPALFLKIQLPGYCDSVALGNDLLISGYRNYGTRVLRITNAEAGTTPSLYLLCTIYRSKDRVRDAKITQTAKDSYAVIADDEGGIDLYSLRNPAEPLLQDEFRTTDAASAITLANGMIYASCWDAGIEILAIED